MGNARYEKPLVGAILLCRISRNEVGGGFLRVDRDLDFATFTPITAWQEMDYEHFEDPAGLTEGVTPLKLIDTVAT